MTPACRLIVRGQLRRALVVGLALAIRGLPLSAFPEEPQDVEAVREAASARLYSPIEQGLESLSFEWDVDWPGMGKVGTARASWSPSAGVDVTFEITEEALALPQDELQRRLEGLRTYGEHFMVLQLNTHLEDNLARAKQVRVRDRGAETSELVLDMEPSADSAARQRTIEVRDGLPTRVDSLGDVFRALETWSWGRLPGARGALLHQRRVTGTVDIDGEPDPVSEQRHLYTYVRVRDFVLLGSTQLEIGRAGRSRATTWSFQNFVVNGEPVADEDVQSIAPLVPVD